MRAVLECRPTKASEFVFIGDEYAGLAEWERDHSWGSLQLFKVETMQDLMEQRIRTIAKGFTHRGSIQDITVSVNGTICYLQTDYNVRTLRTHFHLRSSCDRWIAELSYDDREMA